MPTIFEYLGIVIYFFSSEHEPIHVHAKYNDCECKAEFTVVDGKVVDVLIKKVRGKEPLPLSKAKDFEMFIEHYSEQIVQKWIDCFVYRKKVDCERITKRIK